MRFERKLYYALQRPRLKQTVFDQSERFTGVKLNGQKAESGRSSVKLDTPKIPWQVRKGKTPFLPCTVHVVPRQGKIGFTPYTLYVESNFWGNYPKMVFYPDEVALEAPKILDQKTKHVTSKRDETEYY